MGNERPNAPTAEYLHVKTAPAPMAAPSEYFHCGWVQMKKKKKGKTACTPLPLPLSPVSSPAMPCATEEDAVEVLVHIAENSINENVAQCT